MVGETLNAPPPRASSATASRTLPKHLLYSIFARIGGSGLDTDAFETLRASSRGGFLGTAVAYDNRQTEIPATQIHSLRWHPVRLLSFLDSSYYYGAKKKYIDWIAARHLATGRYDLFHSWSGDCLLSLRTAHKLGIPSVLEIPTWHRDRGKIKRRPSGWAPEAQLPWPKRWKEDLLLQRDRFIEEYDLADLILVLSERAAETFRVQGFPEEKLFYLPRGVDVERFTPGERPPHFRAIFSGALIERKGVHHLLEAWERLDLKEAELWLVGSIHDEIKPYLKKFARPNVRAIGFAQEPETYLRQSTIHIFPSQCEGSAKVTYEAAACGLPQITTREAGDVVEDGVQGTIVPPGNVEALAEAIQHLYDHPEIVERMSIAARERVVENFTWDHFRARLLDAYGIAMRMAR
ncbi:MAG: glycosyltransferase family 4 protein [Chthoniobacterales bacterium]|nr:glycosyltransferase family 4 protein [Chthoniobacterales bacterium]